MKETPELSWATTEVMPTTAQVRSLGAVGLQEVNPRAWNLLGRVVGGISEGVAEPGLSQQHIETFFENVVYPTIWKIRVAHTEALGGRNHDRAKARAESRIADMRSILGGQSYKEIASQTNRRPNTIEVAVTTLLGNLRERGYGPEAMSGAWQEYRTAAATKTVLQSQAAPGILQDIAPSARATGQQRTRKPRKAYVGIFNDPSVQDYLESIDKVDLLTAEQEVQLAKAIEAGLYAAHRLTNEENLSSLLKKELQLIARQGMQAKNHFIAANLRLVVGLAKWHTGKGLSFLDVIQEGNLGLMHAVEKFDYTKGYKFSTYATHWVRQAISRGLAKKGRTVRLPHTIWEDLTALDRARRKLLQDLGREATTDELIERLNTTPEKLKELFQHEQSVVNLDSPIGYKADGTLADILWDSDAADATATTALDRMDMEEMHRVLGTVLNHREHLAVLLRHGLYDGSEWTYAAIGKRIGIKGHEAQKLAQAALEKLRASGEVRHLRDFVA